MWLMAFKGGWCHRHPANHDLIGLLTVSQFVVLWLTVVVESDIAAITDSPTSKLWLTVLKVLAHHNHSMSLFFIQFLPAPA